MSSFYCEHCGAACCDSPQGYITGCQHYLPDTGRFRVLLRQLEHVVKDPKKFVTSPLGCCSRDTFQLHNYGQASLLELWNAGKHAECESIVRRLSSGEAY